MVEVSFIIDLTGPQDFISWYGGMERKILWNFWSGINRVQINIHILSIFYTLTYLTHGGQPTYVIKFETLKQENGKQQKLMPSCDS